MKKKMDKMVISQMTFLIHIHHSKIQLCHIFCVTSVKASASSGRNSCEYVSSPSCTFYMLLFVRRL